MKQFLLLGLIVISALTFWSALAQAQASEGQQPLTRQEQRQEEVKAALRELHQHQVELTALAEDRAERDAILELTDTLQTDHKRLYERLMEVEEEDASVVSGTRMRDTQAFEELKQQEGAEFEAAYLRYQERLHLDALELLERNLPGEGEVSEYARHVKATHDTLRQHLALIQQNQQAGDREAET
ncbi:DUF4142 domain-containing protein [Halomonas sp. ZH2S]|uniref:DUF4142 domain-containing protein n=1 Tax=Vreelandella zhuhanensis TaxID=2684210 RepID=A0A7X3GZR5_9GAMM|nr:DUF4142 domain-containing protein [Halomonas zhuhanensis]MWJ27890.1 DUF4142 domain-containing protein [Halomonas zhuhanensis]